MIALALVMRRDGHATVNPMSDEAQAFLNATPILTYVVGSMWQAYRKKVGGKRVPESLAKELSADLASAITAVSATRVSVSPFRQVLRDTARFRDPLTGSTTVLAETKYEAIE